MKIRSDPKGVMSDTVVLRSAVAGDAACITATIAAAFEQYRGRLVPESGAFRETADGISASSRPGPTPSSPSRTAKHWVAS